MIKCIQEECEYLYAGCSFYVLKKGEKEVIVSIMQSLSFNISENIKLIGDSLKDCTDVTIKEKCLKGNIRICFIYINSFVDMDVLQRDFVKSIFEMNLEAFKNKSATEHLPFLNTYTYSDVNSIINGILSGETLLFVDGIDYAISCRIRKIEKRDISEPEAEKNISGPHEGFIESIETNKSLLRKKIKDKNLKFKDMSLGSRTKQIVSIAYIEGVANPEILNDLSNRISKISVDGIPSTGYIEQRIADSPNSLFPQFLSTERPYKAVAALLEGRFVVILDGTPVILIAPVSIFAFFQALDDYSTNWMFGTFFRFIRSLGMLIAILLPALYIAVTSFQYYFVPLGLIIPLAKSRSQVPFPPIIEALIMEITIDMLRESAIRLPTYLGSTIGVVGGIIIGQSAVNAGIVSTLFIIVVSVTTIASYAVPTYNFGLAVRLLRFAFMVMASIFGTVGIVVSSVFVFAHLLSLESLGQPYLLPIFPYKYKDLKDTIIRAPSKYLHKRPDIARPLDQERSNKDGQKT